MATMIAIAEYDISDTDLAPIERGAHIRAQIEMGMRRAGMRSPNVLAKKAGISRQAAYKYVSGKPLKQPDMYTLMAIADALSMSLEELVGFGKSHVFNFQHEMKQQQDDD